MKGVISDYKEDKGFGFIIDENQENRFFHISDVHNKDLLIKNLSNYYYSQAYNESPKIVEFNPSQNSKGMNATSIKMSNQILNDKSNSLVFKATITDFNYNVDSLTRTVSGIKKGSSAPFGATAGSNGTFRLGYPEVSRELNLSFKKSSDIGWGNIDIRELALKLNQRKSVTQKFVQNLRNKLKGEEIEVFGKHDKWELKDSSILKI